jgi:hypothetical protein
MKKTKILIIALFLLGFGVAMQAQTLDRISLSSGGISSDTLNATLGEIFVFSVSSGGISLDAGSQSDNSNTGGIPSSVTQNETVQSVVLVYPNPVGDLLNLQINGLKSETIAFQVFDISGKLVLQYNSVGANHIHQLQVKQLPSGNYFIQGYTANGENIRKIKFIKL